MKRLVLLAATVTTASIAIVSWRTPPGEAHAASRAAESEAPLAFSGQALYQAACVPCHRDDGRGVPPQIPPLADSNWVTGDRATLLRILILGIQGPIEVRGQRYDGTMPAFGEFEDAELARLATYVRQRWADDPAPFTTAEVAQVREPIRHRETHWRGGAELTQYARPRLSQ